MTRKISISIGPEIDIRLLSDDKSDKILKLNIEAVGQKNLAVYQLFIDCCQNTLTFSKIPKAFSHDYDLAYIDNMYIYFYAVCSKCYSNVNTYETNINLVDKTIDVNSLGIEHDMYQIGNDEVTYAVSTWYEKNYMEIFRVSDDFETELLKKSEGVKCPIFNINFDNIDKTIKRLKTILVFS
jgi:hypothetical protein